MNSSDLTHFHLIVANIWKWKIPIKIKRFLNNRSLEKESKITAGGSVYTSCSLSRLPITLRDSPKR